MEPTRVTITIRGLTRQFEYEVPIPSPWKALWVLILAVKLLLFMMVTASAMIDCVRTLASLVQ